MLATVTAMTSVCNMGTAAMMYAWNAIDHFAPVMATVMDLLQAACAGAIVSVICILMTAAMMPAKNAAFCQSAHLPSPAMANVMDKLPVVAGAIVFVQFHLMTAALTSVMNALLAARKGAGSQFSWWWVGV